MLLCADCGEIMNIKIRKAMLKDREPVAEIEYKSKDKNSSLKKWHQNQKETYEMIEKIFKEKYFDVYILEVNKSLIGYFAISFNKKKKVCYLNYFAIKKRFQGKGLSKLMMKKAIYLARKRKCRTLGLAVWAKNFKAIGLYNKFGFFVKSIKKRYYPNKDDKLIMERLL